LSQFDLENAQKFKAGLNFRHKKESKSKSMIMLRHILIVQFIVVMLIGCSKETTQTNNGSNNANNNQTATPVANQLVFTGNGFANNTAYPKLYTCDSSGFSPALQWSKAPTGTKSYVITMHHYPPTYPSPQNSKNIGSFGINTVNRKNEYTPPCSQGPGAKTYILTLYALSGPPSITTTASQTTMDVVLAGIRTKILDSAVMNVNYTR